MVSDRFLALEGVLIRDRLRGVVAHPGNDSAPPAKRSPRRPGTEIGRQPH